jgi:hypothetical protein
MELTWSIKLRIIAVSALGIAVLGVYAWPLVAPAEPFGVVSVVNNEISVGNAISLLAIAFGLGLVSYFLSWPYGNRIAILAAPAGLALWSVRSGDMGTLMQLNTSLGSRQQIFSTFCWEPILWLGIVIAGFLGAFLASQIIYPAGTQKPEKPKIPHLTSVFNVSAAIIGSAVVTMIFIGGIARDFTASDPAAGYAIGQPNTGQIIFAVLAASGIAAFLVKEILDLDYIWVIISTCLVNLFAISTYWQNKILDYFAGHWPAVFFSNSTLTVLPIQVVAIGSIGAIAGYWIAIRYDYWRLHELKVD